MALSYRELLSICREENGAEALDPVVAPTEGEGEVAGETGGKPSIEFDTVNGSDETGSDEVASGDVTEEVAADEAAEGAIETENEINNTVAETDGQVAELGNIAETVETTEALLANPEEVTATDAAIVTESLRNICINLRVNPNKSRCLSQVSKESIKENPVAVLRVAHEDLKSMYTAVKNAIIKAWKWVAEQLKKFWKFIKGLLPNLRSKLLKLKTNFANVKDFNKSITEDDAKAIGEASPVIRLAKDTGSVAGMCRSMVGVASGMVEWIAKAETTIVESLKNAADANKPKAEVLKPVFDSIEQAQSNLNLRNDQFVIGVNKIIDNADVAAGEKQTVESKAITELPESNLAKVPTKLGDAKDFVNVIEDMVKVLDKAEKADVGKVGDKVMGYVNQILTKIGDNAVESAKEKNKESARVGAEAMQVTAKIVSNPGLWNSSTYLGKVILSVSSKAYSLGTTKKSK